ncbi:MAG: class I SAM-dependent methyltransferase [Gemmatimonadetes bacterium]|nr:class I SAM-dependent methyltransferase [Gemmatimonadota bacterium]
MANDRQYRSNTRFVGTRGVKEYRASIPEWVNESDTVLEIGCEWGTTTRIISDHAEAVIGTDVSPEVIERARERHPHIRFEALDAFDVRAALELNVDFTKIYIDMSGISGYRSLLDLIALLNSYAAVLRPEAIVVKSGALKHFASRCIPFKG